jgi:hypothetical protein
MFSVALVTSSTQHWEQQWSYLLSNFAPVSLFVLLGTLNRKVRPFADYVSVKTAEELPSPLILADTKERHLFRRGDAAARV